jgi:hypothetical protein
MAGRMHITLLESEASMRRTVTIFALLGGGLLIAHKLKLHERLMARCKAMFEQMPQSAPGTTLNLHERVMKQCEAMFPQKRATSNVDNIRQADDPEFSRASSTKAVLP